MYIHWDTQLPALASSYLWWKHSKEEIHSAPLDGHFFHVTVIKTYALLRHGFLGCSPVEPSVAVDLATLEFYHHLRRRHPQLSIQTMTKTLCDLHHFSIVFNAYLNILRHIRSRVNEALGHDGVKAHEKCPCCTYMLKDEVQLVPSILVTQDGNNSSKQIANVGSVDEREFTSTYFLSREDVNTFKDEVKHRQHATYHEMSDAGDNNDILSSCLKWKSSAPEQQKKALDIYEVTGMFASACRHRFIIKACEMVRSVDYILNNFGEDVGLGYDVSCTFGEIVRNSPLLQKKAEDLRLRICVNSFHGYAHNRLCQVQHHPLYLAGFWLEDLETMERVFSSTNASARIIRYATRYHWKQALDMQFSQWDMDKYQELSKFLLNNYRQALNIINEYSPVVTKMTQSLSINEDTIESWIAEEYQFLLNLKEEPEEKILTCSYVQALNDRNIADRKWNQASEIFRHMPITHDIDYSQVAKQTARIEAARRTALQALLINVRAVGELEEKLGIAETWTEAHPDYISTMQYMRSHKFRRVLDNLQCLVVQRLFELSKANMAGTGYKLCVHIGKAIKTRSKAIQSALTEYNQLASSMEPPAPHLEWNDIVNYGFVSEFDLLKLAYSQHPEILSKPWTVPGNREVAVKYFKILRAREEIVRLNVEVRRLRTAISDGDTRLRSCISRLHNSDPDLSAEIEEIHRDRLRVDAVHQSLVGFSEAEEMTCIHDEANGTAEDDDIAADDELNDTMIRLGEFLENLALHSD
ncbi:uncharacterized protein HD556DRAFT_1431927 [Suillus plorans]|uniref:CxC1-like cysteine cluster associated with KDZ transposases domain-containing protein n=1 Tax=Suillus plorans TaxID=116603 RepID=A0A9P7DIV4_9AGAM|nr:uncharacterized protein HD556DRAFT_1431927 [Suillus plorans]KAG1794598.1 hypothetical protein HD556DRAFT_1431927 [Suillus plorans]